MLPLRLVGSRTRPPPNLLRTFTTTTAYSRSPSLADITPSSLASFDAKQKEFRTKLAELQQKKKDASQFRAASSYSQLSPTAPGVSNASFSNSYPSATSSSHHSSFLEPSASSSANGSSA